MSPETITTAVGFVIVIGFLWNLHRDVADLRERMVRLEEQVQILAGNVQTLMQTLIDRERKPS